MATIGRNDPCPCGSGKKYKQCCLKTGGPARGRALRRAAWLAAAVVVLAVLGFVLGGRDVAAGIVIVGALGIGAWLLLSDPPPPSSGGNPGAINFGS